MQRMSARGWRMSEPVEVGPPERPVLLERALRAAGESGLGTSDLAGELGYPSARLERMLALPEDAATHHESLVVELARQRKRSAAGS